MIKAPSPASVNQIQRPKSGRKPLQPRNSPANLPINIHQKAKPKPEWIEISTVDDDSNKENRHGTPAKIIESFDASLAEELSAIRQKLERLRLDKEKTEKRLRDRDLVLERNLKELLERGELQKQLEIEVDRLFRLKELKAWCMRVTPIRSLREKEKGWKIKEDQSQIRAEEEQEEEEEEEEKSESESEKSPLQSPRSEIHTEK